MPELPEVEVSRLGLLPELKGRFITNAVTRTPKLRYPLPSNLGKRLLGARLADIRRRAKYLLLDIDHLPGDKTATLILHLGMSGSLRIVTPDTPPQMHDHVDIAFGDKVLRLRDPRRFGALLWHDNKTPIEDHPLMKVLGVEPLEDLFDGEWLHGHLRQRSGPIKPVLMDSHMVVGIGNIYASEALFLCGIDPRRPCNSLSLSDYTRLVIHIKNLLERSIAQGGTTLRDFISPEGRPGYFQQTLNVYGRSGEPCRVCGTAIEHITQAQRRSFYCPVCQT